MRRDYYYNECPVNEWEEDIMAHILKTGNSLNTYPTGFHIFLRKRDAELWEESGICNNSIIKKVKFRKIVAKGWQVGRGMSKFMKVVVARERYIID